MNLFRLDPNALRALGALIPALLLSACGGGGGDGDGSSAGGGQGSVRVALTDAPACGFDAVNVTIREVRIHRSADVEDPDDDDDDHDRKGKGPDDDDGDDRDKDDRNHDRNDGWTRISIDPPRKINLLDLTNGVLTSLGEAPLEAGHYQQVRLVLASNKGGNIANSVVFSGTGGIEVPIKVPSGDRSGIKLIHGFTVNAGERTDLLLDFDACKSIVRHGKGNRLLKPRIKIKALPVPVETAANGIRGVVDPALLGSNVMVSAQQGGEVILSAAPDPQTGEFFLARLTPGTYDFVMTADGYSTAVIIEVPVADQSAVAILSTSAQPLTLPGSRTRMISGTVLLNPASTTNTVPFVTAKQSGNATTISVKSDAADLLDGTYLLTLPIEAPVSGRFGPLPIPLNPFLAARGKYGIEASAEGYATSPAIAKDISSADANQDFTLVP